jgi:hypothetical protein
MFRDSIVTLSEHLHNSGVTAVTSEADGMFHVYPILMPWAEASREVYRELGEFVRERVTEASELRAARRAAPTGARRTPRRAARPSRSATRNP